MLHFGETFALLTAVVWAFAVILFKKSGEAVHPIALSLFKDVLAVVLLVPTIFLFGTGFRHYASADDYLLLLFSGVLGIGLGDTLFFFSLNLLGAGLSAIVDCLYSPFIIVLSVLWLDERLTLLQAAGALLIISAVLTVTREKGAGNITGKNRLWGIILGASAMAANALGIVMVKPLLERSPLLWATEVRLIGGCIALGLVMLVYPRRRLVLDSLLKSRNWKYTISGSFTGAYLSMILWLAGMKYAPASIAAALNQTSNIFVFIFAALLLREPINLQRTIGIILAVVGAFLVTFG